MDCMDCHHPDFEKYTVQLKNFYHNGEHIEFDRKLETEIQYLNDKIEYVDKSRAKETERNHYSRVISFLKHVTKSFILMNRLKCIKFDEHDSDLQVLSNFAKNDFLVYLLHPEFDLDKYVFHRHSKLIYMDEVQFSNDLVSIFEFMYWSLINHIEELEFDYNHYYGVD